MKKHTLEKFIELAKIANPEMNYDFSLVDYVENHTKVTLICLNHNITFEQKPYKTLVGQRGCKICKKEFKNFQSKKLTLEEFLFRANLAHPNNHYSYDKISYLNNLTKVIITCPVHGDFEQAPGDHFRGRGCLKCSGNVSKGELAWLASLGLSDTKTTIRIGERRFRVDGYDATTNTVYEYNGDYWHGNPKKHPPDEWNKKAKCYMGELYDATVQKEKIIRDAGYNLVTIWESEWEKKSPKPSKIAREYNKSNLTLPYREFLHK